MRQSTESLPVRLRRLENENRTLGARVVKLQQQLARLETQARPLSSRLARSAG